MVEGILKIYQSQTTAELLVILLSQTIQGAYDVEYVGQGSQGVHTGDFITQNSQTSFAHPSAGSDFVSQVWGHNCYELLLMWSIEPKPQWLVMLHFTHRALAVDTCSASWIYLLWDGFNLANCGDSRTFWYMVHRDCLPKWTFLITPRMLPPLSPTSQLVVPSTLR